MDTCKETRELLGRLHPNAMWNMCGKLGADAREHAIGIVGFSTLTCQVFPWPCTLALAVVLTEKLDPLSTSMYRAILGSC